MERLLKSLEERLEWRGSEQGRCCAISLIDFPVEVIENILSFLAGPLSCYAVDSRPKNSKELKRLKGLSDLRVVLEQHPFYQLAATCHTLRVSVEIFASHLLHQYKKLLCFDIVEQDVDVEEWQERIQQRLRLHRRLGLHQYQKDDRIHILPPYRLMWVRWSYCRCLFCGKVTNRYAIFNHLIWVCARCDKREWPKIKRRDILTDKSKCLLPIHLDSPHLVLPNHRPQPKQPLVAHDWKHGLFYLESDIETLAYFVREHDPDASISRAAQRTKNGTLLLKQFNGKTVDINAALLGGTDSAFWSSLQHKGVRPETRLSTSVLAAELIPDWQQPVISQAIALAREVP
ncbi:hypothetical protein E6O75_ATG04851 [Venturia nashicola]|uniref:Uncharacterized protein n=1 Tax=Venturia nashicola TaxID=86259 RepID=A0A4Z1P9S8_9PEZI|nr:hypothetical protein E6O75_ATG04851 [Venturia nashicola]